MSFLRAGTSRCRARRAWWGRVAMALVLLHVVRGLDFVNVTTAQQLQAATSQNVGERHILITDHLDFSDAQAQAIYSTDSYPDKYLYNDALGIYGTQSITGRCYTRPPSDWTTNWKPGHCVLFFTNLNGMSMMEASEPLLWLDSLHFVMGASDGSKVMRRSINQNRGFKSALYMTRVTIEELPGSPAQGYALALRTHVVASELRILNFGPTHLSPVWFLGGTCDLCQDNTVDGAAPNQTLSLLNSTFSGTELDVFSPCDEGNYWYCWSTSIRTFGGDVRLQEVAFVNNTIRGETGVEVKVSGDANVYSDKSIQIKRSFDEKLPDELMDSDLLPSTPSGRFLTLTDKPFKDLVAEIEAALPTTAPAPGPAMLAPSPLSGMPQPASEQPAPAPGPSKATGGGLGTGALAAIAVVGVAAVIAAVVALIWYCRRKSVRARAHRRHLEPDASDLTWRTKPLDAPQAAGREEALREPSDGAAPAIAISTQPNSADWVTMTQWTGDGSAPCMSQGARRSPALDDDVRGRFVTMSAYTGSESSSRRVDRSASTPGPAFGGTDQPQLSGVRRPARVEALNDALDEMFERQQLLMGRWQVHNAIQRRVGGQSVVQFVKDVATGEDLACKFFLEDTAFHREAALYASPRVREVMAAVVDVQDNAHGALVTPGGFILPPFIVVERGRSLNEWALITRPDFATSLQVLVQIVDRLKTLHELQVVHRDLKPGNILWRSSVGLWTLIDFGCAVAVGSDSTIATSIAYAPPEVAQALKDKRQTMRAEASMDIWALGVVIYELLVGERAFGSGRSTKDVVELLTSPDPLPWEAGSVRADSMRKLGMIKPTLLLCLDRNASKRPSASDLLCRLDNLFFKVTTQGHKAASTAHTSTDAAQV